MTSFTVGLDDALAARLARRAAEAGVAPEVLVERAVAEFLQKPQPEPRPVNGEEADPFSWVGMGDSDVLRGAKVDELLGEGFGQ
jgi:hypothetical protein